MDLDDEELRATRKLNGVDREIKVGEYARTKRDGIVKLLDYETDESGLWCGTVDKAFWLRKNNILKHSKNIIDLIEDTDILQVEISEEWVVKEDTIRFIIVGQTYTIEEIKEALENGIYKIKKILSKEQYEQNCYRLEE